MKAQFSFKEQADYYKSRCANQARQITSLMTEKGLDAFKKKCKEEAEKENRDLKRDNQQKDTTIRRLTAELENERARRKAAEDESTALRQENRTLRSRAERAESQNQKNADALRKKNEELAETRAALAGKDKEIAELNKQIVANGGRVEKMEHNAKTNPLNSSMPTSQEHYKKPIQNNRQDTGKTPGAQPGHEYHPRRIITQIPGGVFATMWGEDDPLWSDPDYRFEGYTVRHVARPIIVVRDEYVLVPQFRNIKTGAHKSAWCPSWMQDEQNYSPEAKALILYLTTFANMAVGKTKSTMEAFSHGLFSPSTGFISELSIEFALKSEPERAQAFKEMLGAAVMNTDGTTINVGGHTYYVSICISGSYTLYFFRTKKGKALAEGTPIEHTTAIMVHDHDITYYNYGNKHQECLEHICRYLLDSIETEGEYQWNTKMLDFIKKLMHEAKQVDEARAQAAAARAASGGSKEEGFFFESTDPRARFSKEINKSYREQFVQITEEGLKEYERHPNKTWYKDGINLCKRMNEDPRAYLLFLEDDRVPYTNNESERNARIIKRKMAVATAFRGVLGAVAYCESRSVIEMLRKNNEDVIPMLTEIFARDFDLTDQLRMMKEKEAALGGICEKDRDRIAKTEEDIKKLQESLPELRTTAAAARKLYDDALAARTAALGADSKPDDNENSLGIAATAAGRKVCDTERNIREKKKALSKNQKELATNEANLEKTKALVEKLDTRINARKEKEGASCKNAEQSVDRNTDRDCTVDPERVKAAQAAVDAQKEVIDSLMAEMNDLCASHTEMKYPRVDPRTVSKQAMNAGRDKVKKDDPHLNAINDAYESKKQEIHEAVDKLSALKRELADAKSGRRRGRRTRKASEQTPERMAV